MNDIPRRNRLDKCTPAEIAIFNAMEEVEKMGANVMLTNAIMKLQEAKDFVSDVVDGVKGESINEKDQYNKEVDCCISEVIQHQKKTRDQDIKKWCVERAHQSVQSRIITDGDMIEAARRIYTYITE